MLHSYLTGISQDLRYGLRMLARSPGFAAVALISLSLGICIATCCYSELNGLILRNLPGVSNPRELAALQLPVSYPDYRRFRELPDLFSATFAYAAPVPFNIKLGGQTERFWGHLVTPSYFATLGVRPVLGRAFEEDESQSGGVPAVMVSYRFWQTRLGSNRSVIGTSLRVNGQVCDVIGVGPKDFLGASPMFYPADLWIPITAGSRVAPELAGNALERRERKMFQVARLKPGISLRSAEAELDAASRQLDKTYNFESETRNQGARRVTLVEGGKLIPIRKQDLPFYAQFFMVLAGLVLLIACSNVANMMLARAAERRKEIAVRLSLGATRSRLIRQLTTESLLLAACAGALGFVLSMWIMRLGSQVRLPVPMPVTYDLAPDKGALLFTFILTIIAGAGFGLVPASQATRADLTPALKSGGGAPLGTRRRVNARDVFLLSQVAGSLALLLITGILSIGIQTSAGVVSGFNAQNLYLISVDPIRDGFSAPQTAILLERILDRVKGLPSVTAACLSDTFPVSLSGNGGAIFSTDDQGNRADPTLHPAHRFLVGRDYFDTTGVRILLGRGFRKQDEADDATAVIVSEALVREIWKGADPLGRRIRARNGAASPGAGAFPGSWDHRAGLTAEGRMFEVVGVANDVAEGLLMERAQPAIYFPLGPADYAQPSLQGVTLIVRAKPGLDAIGVVRREISALDTNLTPFNARSMPEQIEQFTAALRMATGVYGFIGVFGLILASVGLTGVTAYSVTQRAREIGIRMALGATHGNVLDLVMKRGALVVFAGSTIGLATAWAGIRMLSSAASPVAQSTAAGASNSTLVFGTPALMISIALLSCFIPALRSVRIDPAVTLREE